MSSLSPSKSPPKGPMGDSEAVWGREGKGGGERGGEGEGGARKKGRGEGERQKGRGGEGEEGNNEAIYGV